MDHEDALRIAQAIERVAEAEERRNELIERQDAERREYLEREERATAERWASLNQPQEVVLRPGVPEAQAKAAVALTRDRAWAILEVSNPYPYVKTARVWATQLDGPIDVQTDQGPIHGEAGDYLVANDDPTSDVWVVAQARFEATYERRGAQMRP